METVGASRAKSGFEAFEEIVSRTVPDHIRDRVLSNMRAAREQSPEFIAQQQTEEATRQREARIARNKAQARKNCGLAGKMWDQTFQAYNFEHTTQFKACEMCQAFARNWPDADRRGILLHGGPGTGKSHLLRATVIELINREDPPDVRFFYVPEIERTLRAEGKLRDELQGTGREVPNTEAIMLGCDILFLDDIAKLQPGVNQGWYLNLIGCLIDQAERTGKPTICLSANDAYGDDDIVVPALEVIKNTLGDAFASRLAGLTCQIQVLGRDRRYDGDTPGWAR